jgi:hypothetical protein
MVDLLGPATILGADRHPHAARRLREAMPGVEWREASAATGAATTTAASDAPGPRTTVHLREDPALAEGAWRIDVVPGPDSVRVDVVGGPFSGVIGAVEALLRAAGLGPDDIAVPGPASLPVGRIERAPALPYRLFWTWDHSTHWDVDRIGMQETGAFNPYMKQPDGFAADYRRMVDFMSRHGIGGVVIYGLLRDAHGGVEAANEVCRYARERGVRVLAGFAVNSYGGVYYEGDHPWNLATFLRQHPELAADTASLPGFHIDDYGYLTFPRGEYTMASLSDRPEMERWHLDGMEWLLGTLDVDGVNLEFGDYAGNDAMEDMRRLLPGLLEKARSLRPDLWLVTELGWDFVAEPGAPEQMTGLPDGCAYQYTYNRSYWDRLRTGLTADGVRRLPTTRTMIRPHAGSQWNRQRYAYMAPHYAELGGLAQRVGLHGASIFGEVSDHSVPNELGYLAFARFTREDDLAWEAFEREEVQPRLGGPDAARRYAALLEHVDADDLDADGLLRARDEVRATTAALADPARRRWGWLEERLSRRIHARLGR